MTNRSHRFRHLHSLAVMAARVLALWHALSLGQGFDDSSDFRKAALAATAAESLGDGTLMERDGRAVLVSDIEVDGEAYRLAMEGMMSAQASCTRLRGLAFACARLIVGTVLISTVLAGRIAMRFLVLRIEGRLDELKGGLRELAGGNLGYRIARVPDAEFALACDDFNHMAERQQSAVTRLVFARAAGAAPGGGTGASRW